MRLWNNLSLQPCSVTIVIPKLKLLPIMDLQVNDKKKENERETWGSKTEFLLSCIGFSVGIGNVWRFPYLAYQYGGGSFIFAYIVLLFLVGKPLYFAELCFGQFSSLGAIQVWRCFPIAKGLGVAMVLMTLNINVYYNVIMSYTLYYMGQSFRSDVPWGECNDWWGANSDCYVRQTNQVSCWEVNKHLAMKYLGTDDAEFESNNVVELTWNDHEFYAPMEAYKEVLNTCNNGTQIASEQFWEHYVLGLSDSIENLGSVKWDLALTLFVCWMIVFLGLIKGIKSAGKVVYFTATFPYVLLLVLFIYGCTLKGALLGLKYLFVPNWKMVLNIQVWRAAAEQLMFSLGIGCGSLVMFASYNKFENRLYKDALFISSLDFVTSLLSGIVIFSVLGHMATEMGLDISQVAKGGQGLAFVTYPEAIARLPVPQLWSILFFFMLFLLAVDSMFTNVENFFTVVYDAFPHLRKWKVWITFGTCMVLFLLGLPCVTQGGQYVLNLMDTYPGGMAGIVTTTIEAICLMWGYGAERFSNDIKFMLGFQPGPYWRLCWKYISPIVLLFVLIYGFVKHKPIQYADKVYPLWADRLGWALMVLMILPVPIWAAVQLYKDRMDWRRAFQPESSWGPAEPTKRSEYDRFMQGGKQYEGGIDNYALS